MLTYYNIKRFDNLSFDDYLIMGSGAMDDKIYSHSFLKSEVSGTSPLFIPSNKVKMGKMVDSILMSPDEVDPSLPEFAQACKIASSIKVQFKGLIDNFIPQVSYTAELSYKGLVMKACGRLDWLLPNHAVIDLKVTDAKTDKEFAKIIEYMGYKNQMHNYRGLSGVRQAFILPYSTKAKTCLSVVKMEYSPGADEWWKQAVTRFGR